MEGTLTKAKLGQSLKQGLGLDTLGAVDFTDQIFELIRSALALGEPVKLSGFINFEVRHKPPRPGRNPKTLKPTLIKARRVVICKAGQKFKAQLRDADLPLIFPE
jgi:integration host factor subunit alpha